MTRVVAILGNTCAVLSESHATNSSQSDAWAVKRFSWSIALYHILFHWLATPLTTWYVILRVHHSNNYRIKTDYERVSYPGNWESVLPWRLTRCVTLETERVCYPGDWEGVLPWRLRGCVTLETVRVCFPGDWMGVLPWRLRGCVTLETVRVC